MVPDSVVQLISILAIVGLASFVMIVSGVVAGIISFDIVEQLGRR